MESDGFRAATPGLVHSLYHYRVVQVLLPDFVCCKTRQQVTTIAHGTENCELFEENPYGLLQEAQNWPEEEMKVHGNGTATGA